VQRKALPFPIGRVELIIMVASLMALNALAIDMMLPALELMSDDFALPAVNDRQWVITSYIYGMAIGSILYGTLADRYGRKPVLLVTTAIYIIFGICCAFAWDYDMLLIARFIQKLGQSRKPAPALFQLIPPILAKKNLNRFLLAAFTDRGFQLVHFGRNRNRVQFQTVAR